MSSVYGYQSSTRDDPRIQVMGNPLDTGFHLLTPERALLLKTFPFCKLNCFARIVYRYVRSADSYGFQC